MTLLNFPPTNGQPTDGSFTYTANGVVYTWDGEKWTANTAGSGGMGTVHFTGDSPPPAGEATETDQWFNTNDGRLYTYTKNVNGVLVWADASPDSQGDQLWDRNGTTLEPANAGDDVDLGTGDLSAAAGTFSSTIFAGGAVANDINVGVWSTNLGGIQYNRNGTTGAVNDLTKGSAAVGLSDGFLNFSTREPNDPANIIERVRISGGGLFVGGTLPASPNITLDANGAAAFKTSISVDGAIYYGKSTSNFYGITTGTSNPVFVGTNSWTNGQKINVGSPNWNTVSDERAKENLTPIDDGLNKVSQLRAVTGNYKRSKDVRLPFLIAQDVQSVLPEAVDSSNPDEMGIRYVEVIPLLVSALHDAKARIEALEAKVQQLEGGN